MVHPARPGGEALRARPRVIVKLAANARTGSAVASEGQVRDRLARALSSAAGGAEFAPHFKQTLTAKVQERKEADVLGRYVSAVLEDAAAAEAIAKQLRQLPEVEIAYVEGQPCPPPVTAGDDPRSATQTYLEAAPGGIDARWAWGWCDGDGVGVVDVEQGWTLDHEDLVTAGITVISGQSHAWHGHGTAVLGQLVGVDNTVGVIGIAPQATARVASQWIDQFSYSTSQAIESAAASMSVGDVLLLEAQTRVGTQDLVPVELESAVRDAIRAAIASGIVVVEAAGNGGLDLDTVTDVNGRQVLNPASQDYDSSGAIMVGAASSAVPHARLGFSNFGGRIDCYGWGQNVVTCGDGYSGTSTTAYTTSFGGTSSASPMVAGAALLLQSWAGKNLGFPFSHDGVREKLRHANHSTPSANPATDRIGVMPNLRAILESEMRRKPLPPKYLSLVYILFGIIDDAPGVVWVPGKGPVPVDPGWGRRLTALARPKRDLLTALAMHELASTIEDEATRVKLAKAATEAMRGAVQRMDVGR